MTVKVRIESGRPGAYWEYGYYESENLLYARCVSTRIPVRTLQGAFELVVDQNRDGAITQIEAMMVAGPNHWCVVDDLRVPSAKPGQVYVTEDIIDAQTQVYLTTPDYSIFCAYLSAAQPQEKLQHVAIADQVVLGVTGDGTLASIWLLGLPPEITQAQQRRRRGQHRSHQRSVNHTDDS